MESGQGDRTATVARLWGLEHQPAACGLFQRLLDPQPGGVEIDILPPQRQQLAASHAGGQGGGGDRIQRPAAQCLQYLLQLLRG
jgi:hypothetical protein